MSRQQIILSVTQGTAKANQPIKEINLNGEKVDELRGASEDQLRAKIAALKK